MATRAGIRALVLGAIAVVLVATLLAPVQAARQHAAEQAAMSRARAPITAAQLASQRLIMHARFDARVRYAALRFARTRIGMPYVWGATGPRAFDCSGLVIWAYGKAGRRGLPRTTWGLVNLGRKVSLARALPGDLVFTNGIEHMGIYVGHGRMLNAPHTGARVRIDQLSRFHVVTIRRV